MRELPLQRISRRRLAVGAAWSAPVIALAAAAPTVAASGPPISVPLTPANWTVSASGTAAAGGYNWNASPPYFNTDGDPALSSTYKVTITTPINVIAGKTYTFVIGYALTWWNALDAKGSASVNGATLSPTITTNGVSGTGNIRINGTFSVTYTATTTGTINFGLTVEITSTATVTQGDDIRWTSLSYTSN